MDMDAALIIKLYKMVCGIKMSSLEKLMTTKMIVMIANKITFMSILLSLNQ